jgi:hypothetical protein
VLAPRAFFTSTRLSFLIQVTQFVKIINGRHQRDSLKLQKYKLVPRTSGGIITEEPSVSTELGASSVQITLKFHCRIDTLTISTTIDS